MELLKTLPGITVMNTDVTSMAYVNPSNVTVLNVLRPFAQHNIGSNFPIPNNIRQVYSAGDKYYQMNGESVIRGQSLPYRTQTDPKPILKRYNSNNSPAGSGRLFLSHDAAHQHSKNNPKSKNSSHLKRKPRSVEGNLTESEQAQIPKSPSKNVTFKLDNDDKYRHSLDAQWTVGISRIMKPLHTQRSLAFEQYGTVDNKRSGTSEQSRTRFYLPLILRRNASRGNQVVPSTAPSSTRQSSSMPHYDRGSYRFRKMADEHRRTMHHTNIVKR